MLKKILLFFVLFLLFGYQNKAIYKKNNLLVDLKQEINDSINFDDDFVNISLNQIKKISKQGKIILETYQGIPVCDSFSLQFNVIDIPQYYYNLYKTGDVEKENFLNYIHDVQIDTLNLSASPIKQQLISIVGFKNNKEFIISDANQNQDFSDDIKNEFNADFLNKTDEYSIEMKNLKILNKLPFSNYTYQTYVDGKIITFNRKFIVYPNPSHYFTQRMLPNEKKYLSFLKFKDYWKGTLTVKNQSYDFYIQCSSNKYASVYIKPKEVLLSATDNSYNRQFMHYLKDTITLSGDLYTIDSIDASISKLYLTGLEQISTGFGSEIGQQIKNYELKDLNHKNLKLLDKVKQKKYTLIDFWGTWCGPCKKMTQELVKTSKIFSSDLNIISIAIDKNEQVVKDYTKNHDMNWTNVFYDKNSENQLLIELKIQVYPTFILLDSKGKILFRGSTMSYDEVLKILSK